MVFSSILFLFWFLPITLLLYFLAPKKYKNIVLLICSLFFYAWGEPKYILIMIFSTVLDFTTGKMVARAKQDGNINQAKRWLWLSISLNLGSLMFFKYSNFFITNINSLFSLNFKILNIKLPIGISFYTFQTMSYTIDIYRGEAKTQHNIFDFATYVTLFPQLIAGPIVRYQDIQDELNERSISLTQINSGINRFVIGLAKKVLLANNIGLVWEQISSGQYNSSVLLHWIGILCFAFQIYFDFSGYSDMAIGLGSMFGFNFPENFNYPYMSKSITEFWRRWHMTLGIWFREYVYIPLGGNRGSRFMQIRNIFVVWILTGIWHGASWNFAIWGLYFAVLLLIEKFIVQRFIHKIPKIMRHVGTLVLILISWVIFAFDSLDMGLHYLSNMFALNGTPLYTQEALYILSTQFIMLIILSIASTNVFKKISLKYKNPIVENLVMLMLFMLSVAYLVDSTYNPFLYFRF